MPKNTSILLGDHFDEFNNHQVKTGKYNSVSEVVRAALRMFEHEEIKKEMLISELKKGENSEFIQNFDRKAFLQNMHSKYEVD